MGDPFRFTQRKMKQFTAIGVLMVSALAASAPYDTYYAPQYYYQPPQVQPYYYTPEAYTGQYVYDRQQYLPSPVVYRYVRSAQQEPAFNQPQSAALENRRAGPPPPGHAPQCLISRSERALTPLLLVAPSRVGQHHRDRTTLTMELTQATTDLSAGTRITQLEVTTTTK